MTTEERENKEGTPKSHEVISELGETKPEGPKPREELADTGIPFSDKAVKLMFATLAWLGFLLLQGGQLLSVWGGKKAEYEPFSLHTVSILLAATSCYLMFNFGTVLRTKEDLKACKVLAIHFFIACGASLLLLFFASLISVPNLLGYPNVFRNLVIMTGSPQGMKGVWVITCTALAVMGFILLRQSRKGK